jgi:RNA polymerase sigma-B factor
MTLRQLHAAPFGSAGRHRHERRLVVLAQGDPGARREVVRVFEPLATKIAQRYHRGPEPLDDLRQVAFTGLLKAADRFDAERATPFHIFAIVTMSGELRRHFRDTGWAVHVTRAAQEAVQRVAAEERRSTEVLTAEELGQRLGMSAEAVVEARITAQAMRAESLDAPVGPRREGLTLMDGLAGPDDGGFGATDDRLAMQELLRRLGTRDRAVIRLRFEQGLSQEEIGRRVGVSQMQVSRDLRRILDDLRRNGADEV